MATSVKVKLGDPRLLAWARESAGYSLSQFARVLHKKEDRIAAWESGTDTPTYRQLEELAKKVKRPVAAFFLPVVPQEPPRPADFRTVPGRGRGQYDPKSLVAFREARNWLVDVRTLLGLTESSLEFSLPSFTIDDDPDQVASEVRELLAVDVGEQISWRDDYYWVCDMWRDTLFDRGVLVMVFRMPFEDVRAFSAMGEGLAAIGVNTADRGYGRVFSMFHEVAHLSLRQPGVSGDPVGRRAGSAGGPARLERYCDRVAASLLLPAGHPEIRDALSRVAYDQSASAVNEEAAVLKVSKYALLGRAWDLRYITEDTYWSTVQDWRTEDAEARRPPAGGDHLVNRVSHVGKRLVSVVFDALDAKEISSYEASKLLGIDPGHFPRARKRAIRGVL